MEKIWRPGYVDNILSLGDEFGWMFTGPVEQRRPVTKPPAVLATRLIFDNVSTRCSRTRSFHLSHREKLRG
jgi:hypothetical protein